MLPVAVIALCGALWIALALFAYALFAALVAPLGAPGAAAVTGAVFLIVAAAGGLIVRSRIQTMKRNALVASLASSGGAVSALMGVVTKRPLVSLGVAGALAALLFARSGDTK